MFNRSGVFSFSCWVYAHNTIMASWWHMRKVRWFGKKETITEDGHTIVITEYKGKKFMTDYWRTE